MTITVLTDITLFRQSLCNNRVQTNLRQLYFFNLSIVYCEVESCGYFYINPIIFEE